MIDVKKLQANLGVTADGALGPKTYAALLAHVAGTAVTPLQVALGAAAVSWFPPADITTPLRLAHALSQWALETWGFSKLEENLNYSAERMTQVWPGRFPTIAAAAPYAHNPEALANKTYGGRNGNTQPDDGWVYRGRGLTGLTGRANYAEAAKLTGLDLVGSPDLVSQPDVGLRVACAYWTARNLNAAADRDDARAVRKLVNGGLIGFDEAQRYLARAKSVLA